MVNSYQLAKPIEEKDYFSKTTPEEYDFNFCFEVPNSLKSNGVKLEPLIPSLHAQSIFNYLSTQPIVSKYLAYGPFTTLTQFLTFLEMRRNETGTLLFIIRDLSLPIPTLEEPNSNLAGFLAVLKGERENMIGEIGHIHIFERFQRSHVTTHAVGLLQFYLLDTIGVRRCLWFHHSLNLPSASAAKRLGFTPEGTLHWARILPKGKSGIELPSWAVENEFKEGRFEGRHDGLLVITWIEWKEGGIREKIKVLMDREVVKRDLSAVGR